MYHRDNVVLAERSKLWDDPEVLASYCGPLATTTTHGADRYSMNVRVNHHSRQSKEAVTPPTAVETRLLDYQRAHDAKMFVMRQEKRSTNEEHFTGAPKVNPKSAALAQKRHNNTSLDLHTRLYQNAPESTAAPAPSLVEDSRFGTPKINKRSSELPTRGIASQLDWQRERLRRQETKRDERDAQEREANSGQPTIDEGSRRLAQRCSTYNDPMRLVLPVEDRLLRHHDEVYARNEARRKELELLEKKRASTSKSTTPRKADTLRDREVAESEAADRLFGDAEERRRIAEERARQDEILGMIDQNGNLLYRPKLSAGSVKSPAATQRRRGMDVFTYLANQSRHESSEMMQMQREETEQEQNTGRPHIGAYSVLLANLTRPQGVDTFERLATTPRTGTTMVEEKKANAFQPEVDKRSDQIDRERRGEGADRIQLLYQRQAGYDAHRRRLQQEKEISEAQEAENLRKLRATRHGVVAPANGGSSSSASGRCITPDAAYQRMKAWSERNENKLQALRTAAKDEEVAHCTFEPTVLRGRAVTPPATRIAATTTTTTRSTPKHKNIERR